jgi:hypothetical protein
MDPAKSEPAKNVVAQGTPAWAEIVQLVPVVTLALPFIVSGNVDLSEVSGNVLVAALLTIPATGVVMAKGHTLNPIALGTAVWLWLGSAALYLTLEPLRGWLLDAKGLGLFALVFLTGCAVTLGSDAGFLGYRGSSARARNRTSAVLLATSAGCVVWAWVFRHDVRIGGGLPFIVLNVLRRRLIARVRARE